MNKGQIKNLTPKILEGELEEIGQPKVAGQFVVLVENEPDEFRMAVTDVEGLEDEFALAIEGGISLAVEENVTPGFYTVVVAIKKDGESVSVSYTISEFQLTGLWLRLKEDLMVLETLTS
jgi:hypothetical protein